MNEVCFAEDCTPPGTQGVLFVDQAARPTRFRALGTDGVEHVTTSALGVALSAASHLAAVDGDAWVTADDGTSAHLVDGEVLSATPHRPWIRTVVSALHEGDPHHDHR